MSTHDKASKAYEYQLNDWINQEKAALDLTTKQAATVKNYLIKKGINQSRIKTEAKGRKEPRKECHADSDCKEEDHKMNRRVEFLVYKG